MQPVDIKALTENKDVVIRKKAKGAVWYLGLSQKNKYLKIPQVRQALKYLIDYKGIEQTILNGKATIHQSFLPKGFLGALDENLTKYRARKHDIYIGRWGPDYMDPHTNADTFARNPDNSDNAKSKPLAWRNSWDIPEMTKKADAAVLERDTAKRAKMYIELQREHQQVSPFVIMFQDIEVVGERANVKGFIIGPSFDSNFYQYVTK